MTVVVGSGAGFSGDRTDAAIPVVDELIRRGDPCALMFETLGERTLAAAQRTRREAPDLGYEPLLRDLLEPVLGDCLANRIPVLGNFGAANPVSAAHAIGDMTARTGQPDAPVAVVTGDDIRARLSEIPLEAWENECSVRPDPETLLSANVYLGAEPLVEALNHGAAITVTGRVADPALALAPVMHHHGWRWDDWDRVAAGTMAGHLVECGSQVTGGYFADPGYKDVPAPADLGYPLVEVESSGRLVVCKPRGTGGCVTEQTVKEQLLYEVHDPARYVTPDVVVDLSRARVRRIGRDRVEVTGIRGQPRPELLKTTVCSEGEWQGEAEISFAGPNALARAYLAADILRERLEKRVPRALRRRFDFIGSVSVFGDDAGTNHDELPDHETAQDIRLRLAVQHPDRWCVEHATHEVLALYCCGPAGGGGVRRTAHQRITTTSFLVPRHAVHPAVALHDGTPSSSPDRVSYGS